MVPVQRRLQRHVICALVVPARQARCCCCSRRALSMLHSYDTLLPVSEVEIDSETPEKKGSAYAARQPVSLPAALWEVQARWLTDLKIYNEFMNEEDYEVEDEQKLVAKPKSGCDNPA